MDADHPAPPTPTGPQIRSRITVVCAECKRLKLKCDRRAPCGSCIKRNTLECCIYSPAAAEKVDLHSLNNRLNHVEATLATLTAGTPNAFARAKTSFSPATGDRAVLTVTSAGASRLTPLDDTAPLWLDALAPATPIVKPEPTPASLPPHPHPHARLPSPSVYYTTGSTPRVTPELVALLPSISTRNRLLTAAAPALRLRSIPWPRVDAFLRRPPPVAEKTAKARTIFFGDKSGDAPDSVALFAAGCAVLALGALVADDESSMSIDDEDSVDSAFLRALAAQALGVCESAPDACDLDFIGAQVVLMHAELYAGADGLALIGKMVNAARGMGLGVDPDTFRFVGAGGFDAADRARRRVLWSEVVHCDLLVADATGHPPLLRGVADLDLADNNDESFFALRCRLTQLIRTSVTTGEGTISGTSPTLEQATQRETAVNRWLSELPHEFQMDVGKEMMKMEEPGSEAQSIEQRSCPDRISEDLIVVAQRCELAITAHRHVLKLYLPFLQPRNPGLPPPHQAQYGAVDAAHGVVRAVQVLYNTWKDARDATAIFGFGALGHAIFDAAVVCAYAVAGHANAMWAATALADARAAVAVLHDSRLAMNGISADIGRAQAAQIAETLLWRAEHADATPSGVRKRRHGELEGAGVALPFGGPGVAVAFAGGGTEDAAGGAQPELAARVAAAVAAGAPASAAREKGATKHAKRAQHGIRVRVPKDNQPPLTTRLREGAEGLAPLSASSDALGKHFPAPAPRTQAPPAAQEFVGPPAREAEAATVAVMEPELALYRPCSPAADARMQDPERRDVGDYGVPFDGGGGAQEGPRGRRFSIHEQPQQHRVHPPEQMRYAQSVRQEAQEQHAQHERFEQQQERERQRHQQAHLHSHPHMHAHPGQHPQHQQHPQTFNSAPPTYDSPPFDAPRTTPFDHRPPFDPTRNAFEQVHGDSYGAASSPYAPPSSGGYTAASSPYTTTSGDVATPAYGAVATPPSYTPQTQGYYPGPTYEAQYEVLSGHTHGMPLVGLGMAAPAGPSVPSTPLYEKPHPMYDTKPPDGVRHVAPSYTSEANDGHRWRDGGSGVPATQYWQSEEFKFFPPQH